MRLRCAVLASALSLVAPSTVSAERVPKPRPERARKDTHEREHPRRRHRWHWLTALSSWYYSAGLPIACPDMDSYAMGVANRTLPCGTRLVVCFVRCVQAVVFDRGPYVWPRSMDLSQQVAQAVGFDGVATVRYRVVAG